MNYRLMLRTLGRVLQVEALCVLLPLAVAFCYRENPRPFLYTFVLLAVLGTVLSRLRCRPDFFTREGFVVVGLIWIVMSLFGALPYWFSGELATFADCFFEIVSGFTTTGASILPEIESLSRSILFWRGFTSWVGGMGVLIFTLAFLPKVGGRTQVLVQAESPGPVSSKLVPKTAQSSKILCLIYIGFTLAEIALLCLAGLPLYDAATTTFATVCTGGFCVRNASVAAYASPVCEVIIIVFMILCSLNFAVFFLFFTGRVRQALGSDELRFFLGTIAVATVLVFLAVLPGYDTAGRAFLDSLFQVTSVISTTGFVTVDYDLWPMLARSVLVIIMLIGGCAGSTAGGLKCSRVLLLARCAQRSLSRVLHPRAVKVVKLDGKAVDEDTLSTLSAFFTLFFLTLAPLILVVSLDGFPPTTTFSAALACLGNIGPGLEMVGPTGSFAPFSGLTKVALSFAMLVGRLEIFPVLILLNPATWRRS